MNNIEVSDMILFVAPLVTSSLSLAALHWLPWNRGVRPLTRTTAYTVGTLVTVGVPVMAMLTAALLEIPHGELFWAAVLVANALVSGATVNACYLIDSVRALSLEDMANERR